MKIYYTLIISFILLSNSFIVSDIYSQACCVGNSYDIAVLPLTKQLLFNAGYNFENYEGNWDTDGKWLKNNFTSYQMRFNAAAAYRFNDNLQGSLYMPLIYNRNELPGLKPDGFGIGDVSISGRYEFTHEYEIKKKNGKRHVDDLTPYIAATLGLIFPTGISDESAESEAGITGKGYYSTLLGLSLVKTLSKDKFQLGLDINWQHNFLKTYNKYFNQPLTVSYKKSPGDRYNFNLTANYTFSDEHNASLSFGGFIQENYKIDDVIYDNSTERLLNFSAIYSYYPSENFRLTPAFKWNIFSDNFGKNTTGSLVFTLNAVYYIDR